jgi:hypothetical protein
LHYDWGNGIVYGGYSNYVGFQAAGDFFVEEPGVYTFIMGSDDGSILKVDGFTVISMWYDGPYRERRVLWYLSGGWHNASIDYYEYTSTAKVYFDVDKGNLFTWEETQYAAILVPRILVQQIPKQRITVANRTVTETVYTSMLEYLMKGGRP